MRIEEFILTRLDEDEIIAITAVAGNSPDWQQNSHPFDSYAIRDGNCEPIVYNEGAPSDAEAAHIARHDPARVLRQVTAMREITKLSAKFIGQTTEQRSWSEWHIEHRIPATPREENNHAYVLKLLAAIWSDHPDYDPAWTK